MIRNPFKHPHRRSIFDAMIAAAKDPDSELYQSNGQPRRGALHRCAFWDGFNGITNRAHAGEKDSLSYACWRAGKAWRKNSF